MRWTNKFAKQKQQALSRKKGVQLCTFDGRTRTHSAKHALSKHFICLLMNNLYLVA